MSDIEVRARKVCAMFRIWLDTDGLTPEPEFDDLLDSLRDLEEVVNRKEREDGK